MDAGVLEYVARRCRACYDHAVQAGGSFSAREYAQSNLQPRGELVGAGNYGNMFGRATMAPTAP